MTKLEVKHQCFFFSKSTVPTVKGIIVHFHDTTVRRQGEIIPIHDDRIIRLTTRQLTTFRRQNIALNMWKIVNKSA